ncbi:CRISPR-associated protein Csc1/Cas5 [Halalkaliarchaeum desulfuricum]|uniref:CRISPR-associated protein Csc1/Cas5 n=1 Tax=Halalkaliarchaeum desulfuricum TaxID=2055893 RepID=A0A343TGI0_9EURY|nr:type I-D CRISPR-associated protein Cas5/Csc1 [Halalkaliarchaeum desulfuricum]AUX08202.1 CRISPR-associated protein Csc1/Cas5 [Halalkaliarchaeum desulfuricum]
MDVLEATLRTRGEVTFTSREVGRLADTEPYILNTALYYALGLASGRYVDTSYEPTYVEDTAEVTDVYVSPAAPVSGSAPNYVTTTYNATSDEYAEVNYSAQDDPNAKQNLPSYGRRRSLAHSTPLRFFVISRGPSADKLDDRLPQYVRLGKKRGKARLDIQRRSATRKSGQFRLNHPIGAYDYPTPPEGNVVTKSMKPTPLVLQGDYTGKYVSIDREDDDRVRFPADLTFLATKR